MGRVVVTTRIHAAVERCFDLARDVDVHQQTSAFASERVVPPGRTTGLLELGETVTFEGRHFGLRWRLTARIVEMDRPTRFIDEIAQYPFTRLQHVREFRERDGVTEMIDTLDWKPALGLLGRIVDRLFVERHMTWYVTTKQQAMKAIAERERETTSR